MKTRLGGPVEDELFCFNLRARRLLENSTGTGNAPVLTQSCLRASLWTSTQCSDWPKIIDGPVTVNARRFPGKKKESDANLLRRK